MKKYFSIIALALAFVFNPACARAQQAPPAPQPAPKAEAAPPAAIPLADGEKAALDALLAEWQVKQSEIQTKQAEIQAEQEALRASQAELETLRQRFQTIQAQARADHGCRDCVLDPKAKVLAKPAPPAPSPTPNQAAQKQPSQR